MSKIEDLVKFPIAYLRHIQIISCHMVSIYSKKHITWIWKQCLHIHNQNIHYQEENLFLHCSSQFPRI